MSDDKRNVIALLERGRAMCEPRTWYQLAKRTGIADTTISRCIRRGGTLGDINAVKLGNFLHMDVATVMAYMAEDRAQDEQTKTFWSAQLPRLLPSVAIALALAAAQGKALTDGATQHQALLRGMTTYTLCAIRKAKLRLKAALLRTQLVQLITPNCT